MAEPSLPLSNSERLVSQRRGLAAGLGPNLITRKTTRTSPLLPVHQEVEVSHLWPASAPARYPVLSLPWGSAASCQTPGWEERKALSSPSGRALPNTPALDGAPGLVSAARSAPRTCAADPCPLAARSWGSWPGARCPGRSCSGSTPINAAVADGRWAPARPPPPAAQWAQSLGRTMRPGPRTCSRPEGRWPSPARPVRPRPRRMSLGRARPTAPRGLWGSAAGPASGRPLFAAAGRRQAEPPAPHSGDLIPGPPLTHRHTASLAPACEPPGLAGAPGPIGVRGPPGPRPPSVTQVPCPTTPRPWSASELPVSPGPWSP